MNSAVLSSVTPLRLLSRRTLAGGKGTPYWSSTVTVTLLDASPSNTRT